VAASITPEIDSTEAELVRASKAGDRSAFGQLYERYARMVHGVLLTHVSYTDAEDLLQDVFLRALQQLESLRDPAAFGGWLAAIARRSAADFHRKKWRLQPIRDIVRTVRAHGEGFAIMSALRKLPETYRETLILRLVEGMTGPEIAARTGLKQDSVRVNLCRGMKLLRSALEGTKHE
jgi:RNA polymerase sigma-70 factor (ECF subfamily)